jgi:dihydrofolate reductase
MSRRGAEQTHNSRRVNHVRRIIDSTLQSLDGVIGSPHLTGTNWNNSTIVRGEVVREVKGLKEQAGRDLILYGHGPLGEELLEHHLLDEVQFAIHLVFVGEGATLHRQGAKATLELTGTKTLGTGVVVVTYRPVRGLNHA